MHTKKESGFSRVTFSVVFVVSAVVVSAGVAGLYTYKKQSQLNDASGFVSSFIVDLEKGETTKTFELLGDTLKSPDQSSAYYSWLYWSSSFEQNNIEINEAPLSRAHIDESIASILTGSGGIVFSYGTSVDSKISLTVARQDTKWMVVDYAAVE